jgi:hypothetical protein
MLAGHFQQTATLQIPAPFLNFGVRLARAHLLPETSMPALPVPLLTISLLVASNVFMTFAWYGHLKFKSAPLLVVILASWGIAFFEYLLQGTSKNCT